MDTTVHIHEPSTNVNDQDPIIVVGAGPAGFRFCEEFLSRNSTTPVLLIGNEPYQPYDRVRLSVLLAGAASQADLTFPLERLMSMANFSYRMGNVKSIDPQAHAIQLDGDFSLSYQKLVLATGSRAHVPNIEGVELDGVYTFRNMRDTERLKARTARSRRLVVVGGGLLGIEAANALNKGNTKVTLVQQADRLMNRQLDDVAAQLLRDQVEGASIKVVTESGVRAILGDNGRVEGVRLRDGSELECDSVLIAAGIRPNIELARSAKIRVTKGIRINDQLTTSDPDVLAIGECAEHNGEVYGLVAPGLEQASVAAAVLCLGQGQYLGSHSVSRLKVMDETVFSMGLLAHKEESLHPRTRVYTWSDSKANIYRKLVVHDGVLVGAMAIGDWAEIPRIQELITHQRKLSLPFCMRFSFTGNAWSAGYAQDPNAWPETAIICNCNSVTRGELSAAMEQGACSVTELSDATRAATTCGSCKPLLVQMIGENAVQEPEKLSVSTLLVSAFALLCAAIWLFFPALTVSDSVLEPTFLESIWNDGFFKQVTGFTLVGITAVGLLMSLRKRLKVFSWGGFTHWRLLHVCLSVFSLVLLLVHTGLNTGMNLNFWLLINFLSLAAVGGIAGAFVAQQHRLSPSKGRMVRQWSVWSHLLLSWPLPALLCFHILSVYYF